MWSLSVLARLVSSADLKTSLRSISSDLSGSRQGELAGVGWAEYLLAKLRIREDAPNSIQAG